MNGSCGSKSPRINTNIATTNNNKANTKTHRDALLHGIKRRATQYRVVAGDFLHSRLIELLGVQACDHHHFARFVEFGNRQAPEVLLTYLTRGRVARKPKGGMATKRSDGHLRRFSAFTDIEVHVRFRGVRDCTMSPTQYGLLKTTL